MKKYLQYFLLALPLTSALIASQALANVPVETSLSLDEFERQFADGDGVTAWSVAFSVSKDVHSFNVISEAGHTDGDIDGHEMLAFYGRSLSDFSAITLGWRGDLETDEERNWLLTGYEFSAPMGIDVASTLFWGSDSRVGLRIDAAKEFSLSDVLTLVPETRIHANAKDEPETGSGSGLSDVEFAFRLFYAVTEDFSPYAGAIWVKSYGDTADYLRADGEDTQSTQYVLGFSYSF